MALTTQTAGALVGSGSSTEAVMAETKWVKIVSSTYYKRVPTVVGSIVEMPKHLALQLVHTHKAEWATKPEPKVEPKVEQKPEPVAEVAVVEKPKSKSFM